MKYLLTVVLAHALLFAAPAKAQAPPATPPAPVKGTPLPEKDQNVLLKALLHAQNVSQNESQAKAEAEGAGKALQGSVADVKARNHCSDLQQDPDGTINCVPEKAKADGAPQDLQPGVPLKKEK